MEASPCDGAGSDGGGAGSRAGWQAVQSRRSISTPITIALAEPKFAPLLKVPLAKRGEPCGARSRFPLPAGRTLRRGSSIALVFAQCIPSVGEWLYSGVMIYNNHRPPPNLPCTRGRNSLPACGEGWGGGDMLKPLRIGTDYPRACAVSGIGLPRCLPRSCPQAASMSCPRSTRWVVSMPAASRIARNRRTRAASGRWNPSGVGT